MRTLLIILNWVVIALLLAYGAYFASTTSGTAEAIGGFIGAGGLWTLAPLLTLLAFRRHSGTGVRRAAAVANGLVIALFVIVGLGQYSGGELGYFLLGVATCSTPFALNLQSLWRMSHPKPANLALVKDEPAPPAPAECGSEVYAATVPNALSPPAITPPPAAPPVKVPNYFLRHWRGELSLPVAYWGNGVLLTVMAFLIFPLVTSSLEAMSLRVAALGGIAVILVAIVASVWQVVGTWRSANHHSSRGGSRGWATTAQFMLIIGSLSFAGTLINNLLPQLKELTLIATGNDPMSPIEATISTDGRTLILKGTFGEGSAAIVRPLLEAAPGLATVMLQSRGGRLYEAEAVAAMVEAFELDTYVESHCESACTFVFLAGADRAATPNAKIGFHQPWFPGMDSAGQAQMLTAMQEQYRQAGISRTFLAKIAETPPEDMWYPTRDELTANGVITRVSTGGEVVSTAFNPFLDESEEMARELRQVPIFAAYERHFPGIVDRAAAAARRVHEDGGTDAEVMTAARTVIADHADLLLEAANAEQLRVFVELSIDQLKAAQAISNEACGMLIAGTLNVANTLSPELVQRELDWNMSVLAGSLTPRPPVGETRFNAAVDSILANLDPDYLAVAVDLGAYTDDPGLQCEASIAFYRALMAIPEPDRSVALQAIFQAE